MTPEQKVLYCETLREHGNHAQARLAVGMRAEAHLVKAARAEDEEFDAQIDEALELFRFEQIEDTIRRRAVDGVEKDVWWNGAKVGTEIVLSDRLLALLARAHVPAYKDKLEVVNATPTPINVDAMSAESQEKLREILRSEVERREREGTE
jgi:hypothetical protein